MRAGRRFGPLLRCKGVVAAGLTALPALFALSTGTPAVAATSAHQKPKPSHRQDLWITDQNQLIVSFRRRANFAGIVAFARQVFSV
jgi:hypothetical protein